MSDTYPRFTVAAIQAAPVLFDRDRTTEKAIRFIEEAADKGAVIIGFPECYIPGYPGNWYEVKDSNPLPFQGELFIELVKNAVKVPSPTTNRLCTAAKKAHAWVVMGVSELDNLYPGTLYISQLIISDKGEIVGVHRKLVPTYIEKLIYSSGDGSHFNVYDTPYGKLSVMNCGENTHDLYKYALLSMGTQIHVASWPPLTNKAQVTGVDVRVRQFALEGKIFIISSAAVLDKQNIDKICNTKEEKAKIVPNDGGGSMIIGPSAEYLNGPVYGGEAVLTTEVSLEDCLPGKQMHNVLGHYTRWDIFSLNFNRERLSPFKNVVLNENRLPEVYPELVEIKKGISEIREKLDKIGRKPD